MKPMVWIFVVVVLVSCGKENVAHRDNVNLPGAPTAPETSTPKSGEATPATAPALDFAVAQLSGDVHWDAAISADEPAAFEVKFWAKGDAARTAVAPPVAPVAFFVMKCCKSVTEAKLVARSRVYRAEGIRLSSGEYTLNIQLGPGKLSERSSVDIVVP